MAQTTLMICYACKKVFEFPFEIVDMDRRLVHSTPIKFFGKTIGFNQQYSVPWTCTNCYVKSYYLFLRYEQNESL